MNPQAPRLKHLLPVKTYLLIFPALDRLLNRKEGDLPAAYRLGIV